MKTFILILDIVVILLTLYLLVDIVLFVNKNKKSKDINNYLNPRLKVLKLLTIVLTVISLLLVFNNIFDFL